MTEKQYLQTMETLWGKIEEAKLDMASFMVLADLMEEYGPEEEQHKARCLRWCWKEDKRPYQYLENGPDGAMHEYHWYSERYEKHCHIDPESNLPEEMFKDLPNIQGKISAYLPHYDNRHAEFETRREAMEALFVTFKKWEEEKK